MNFDNPVYNKSDSNGVNITQKSETSTVSNAGSSLLTN